MMMGGERLLIPSQPFQLSFMPPWFSRTLKSPDMAHGPGEGSLPQLTRGETGDNREDVQAPCDAGL